MLKKVMALRACKSSYRKLFLTETGALRPEAQEVLADLYKFAFMFKNVSPDPQGLALIEGRRQTINHMLKRLKTTESELRRIIEEGATDDE